MKTQKFYTNWDEAQEAMKDSDTIQYDPNNVGWVVTFKEVVPV